MGIQFTFSACLLVATPALSDIIIYNLSPKAEIHVTVWDKPCGEPANSEAQTISSGKIGVFNKNSNSEKVCIWMEYDTWGQWGGYTLQANSCLNVMLDQGQYSALEVWAC